MVSARCNLSRESDNLSQVRSCRVDALVIVPVICECVVWVADPRLCPVTKLVAFMLAFKGPVADVLPSFAVSASALDIR